jgi:crotonobetaine/carnitine-CoA ligase
MSKLSIRRQETTVGSAIGAVRGGYDVRKLTIAEVLSIQARMHPDKLFLRYLPDGRSFSFSQMAERTSHLALGLQSIGVGTGTHVSVMLENSPELLLCHFAIGVLAAVTVPINVAARGQSLRHLLLNSESSVLVIEADLLERYVEVADYLPRMRQLVIVGGVEADIVSVASIRFESLLTRGCFNLSESPATFQSLAYILYTSGTTGPSKGVMLTQARSLLWGIGHAEVYGHRTDDVFYVCLPLTLCKGLYTSR